MNTMTLDQRKTELSEEIEPRRTRYETQRKRSTVVAHTLVMATISLSTLAAILGFINLGQVSGIVALIVGALIPLESAFKFQEKSSFYRILVSECNNLLITLQFRVDSEAEFELVVEKFQVVIATAAKSLPRGQGMETVKKLYEDLDRKGILLVPEVEMRN